MKLKEFIQNIKNISQKLIEQYEGYKELNGVEKKQRLDEAITKYVNNVFDILQVNFIVKIILKSILINNIPYITQAIYDLVKAKVDGVTK